MFIILSLLMDADRNQDSGAALHISDKEVLGDRLINLSVHFVHGAVHVPVTAE